MMGSSGCSDLSLFDRPEEWLNKLIDRDGLHKDLTSLLAFETTDKVSVSGTREIDYPPTRFRAGGELEVCKSFSLPPDLVDKFSGMQKNCLMGIFSLCQRAWVTIDNELFMWNYEDGEDLAYYDGINDTIIAVGLAVPRSGVLPSGISFLLCIATPLEIVVLGMTYAQSSQNAPDVIQVFPEPLYILPTDNFTVSCIEATDNGRIFLGTREGFLLEMTYSPIPGCNSHSPLPLPNGSSGPCYLINHSSSALSMLLPTVLTAGFRSADSINQLASDPARRLVYARTDGSNLSVYSYSDKSGSVSRLASLASSDLAYAAAAAVRSVDKGQFRSIVSIHPLSTGLCHLMAFTKTGIRLYFGADLRLLHIRLPPTSPHGTIGLDEVKLVAETRGTVVLVSALPHRSAPTTSSLTSPLMASGPVGGVGMGDPFVPATDGSRGRGGGGSGSGGCEDYDVQPYVLYTISPDPYPWTPNLAEVCTTAWCTGGAWALVVLPSCDTSTAGLQPLDESESKSDLSSSTKSTSEDASSFRRGPPPVVLTQHLDPPSRRLVLISAQGVVHLRLPSPMTRLKEFLMKELSVIPRFDSDNVNERSIWSSARLTRSSYPLLGLDDSSAVEFSLNTGFLTAYLHQFSPDEAICAALAIGAAHFAVGGDATTRGLGLAVEQAVLYFAAEAAQFWIPSVRRSQTGAGRGPMDTPIGGSSTPVDKTLATGLFLFSGLCVFVARVGRTFWRSSLFRDASSVAGDHGTTADPDSKGLSSWMRRFVNTLATASPLGSGSRQKSQAEQPVISRLDPEEIGWLMQQLTYARHFLRRQLDVRGGWLRASNTPTTMHTNSVRMGSGDGVEHVDAVLLQRLAEELDQLLSLVLELLGFWRILSEHVVHKVVRRLSPDQRQSLLHVPFEMYATCLMDCFSPTHHPFNPRLPPPPLQLSSPSASPASTNSSPLTGGSGGSNKALNQGGLDLITALINALIEYYLTEASQDVDSGVNLDGITSRLQAACPTLFVNEDAISAKASEYLIQASLLRSSLLSTNELEDPSVADANQSVQTEIEQLVSQALSLYTEAGPCLDLESAVQRLEAAGAWRAAVALCLAVAQRRDPNNVAVECLKLGRRPSAEPIAGLQPDAARSRRRLHAPITELAATEGRYDAYHRLINCLERLYEWSRIPPSSKTAATMSLSSQSSALEQADGLQFQNGDVNYFAQPDASPASARAVLNEALRDVIKSDDILAHFEVLGWLLSHGLIDTLIGLNSPHFEAYLRSRLRQTPDDPDLRCLLWRQLERRGARLEAAQVLEHLAVTPCRQLTLDDRLDFAARAIVAVKALPPAQQDLDYLRELEARLELAQLQQQLCSELSQLGPELLHRMPRTSPARNRPDLASASSAEFEEALEQLTHGPLLSLTEMFTNYADRFGLHESKLCLLWTSGSTDEVLIRAVWRDLLRHILFNPKSNSDLNTSTVMMGSPAIALRRSPAVARHSPLGSSRTPDRQSRQLIELSLVDCLSRLGQRFATDGGGFGSSRARMFFPLPEIVSTLEYYAIQNKFVYTWVPTILRDTQLTAGSSFVEAYDTLLHSKDTFWRRSEVRNRLFLAFVTVIEDFLSTGSIQLPMRQRMLQVGRILDRVASNLVDLNSDLTDKTGSGADLDDSTQVINRLRRVRDQLQRYYR